MSRTNICAFPDLQELHSTLSKSYQEILKKLNELVHLKGYQYVIAPGGRPTKANPDFVVRCDHYGSASDASWFKSDCQHQLVFKHKYKCSKKRITLGPWRLDFLPIPTDQEEDAAGSEEEKEVSEYKRLIPHNHGPKTPKPISLERSHKKKETSIEEGGKASEQGCQMSLHPEDVHSKNTMPVRRELSGKKNENQHVSFVPDLDYINSTPDLEEEKEEDELSDADFEQDHDDDDEGFAYQPIRTSTKSRTFDSIQTWRSSTSRQPTSPPSQSHRQPGACTDDAIVISSDDEANHQSSHIDQLTSKTPVKSLENHPAPPKTSSKLPAGTVLTAEAIPSPNTTPIRSPTGQSLPSPLSFDSIKSSRDHSACLSRNDIQDSIDAFERSLREREQLRINHEQLKCENRTFASKCDQLMEYRGSLILSIRDLKRKLHDKDHQIQELTGRIKFLAMELESERNISYIYKSNIEQLKVHEAQNEIFRKAFKAGERRKKLEEELRLREIQKKKEEREFEEEENQIREKKRKRDIENEAAQAKSDQEFRGLNAAEEELRAILGRWYDIGPSATYTLSVSHHFIVLKNQLYQNSLRSL
ncbi:uncharacterized protein L201_005689 [Kwoniella dendrophila CBS 6074]|uniref:Uncharacterized protein n=1 Tax=Kwoniella dendrophila CBS 6074 TaxID=1295534 RepID=A0AAX4JZH1_9TREE